MAMALKQEELEVIGKYVQNHLEEWLPGHVLSRPEFGYPSELTERMVRVEEELKNQRELMKQGFDQIDKRIELRQINMDKRFEQVDKRFEQMQINMDKRFEQVDSNLENLHGSIKSLETRMFHFMVWSFGFTATIAGIIIAVIKFM